MQFNFVNLYMFIKFLLILFAFSCTSQSNSLPSDKDQLYVISHHTEQFNLQDREQTSLQNAVHIFIHKMENVQENIAVTVLTITSKPHYAVMFNINMVLLSTVVAMRNCLNIRYRCTNQNYKIFMQYFPVLHTLKKKNLCQLI